MKTGLYIVVIEDVVADVVLINHELRKGGLNFRITRVETKAEFLNEIRIETAAEEMSSEACPWLFPLLS